MHKLILSVAALITSLALAWTAYNGVQIHHHTDMMFMNLSHGGSMNLSHDGSMDLTHDGSMHLTHDGIISH